MSHLIPAILIGALPTVHVGYEIYERVRIGSMNGKTVEDLTLKVKAFHNLDTAEIGFMLGGMAQSLVFFVAARVMQWTLFPVMGMCFSLGYTALCYTTKLWANQSLDQERTVLYRKLVSQMKQEWGQFKQQHPKLFESLNKVQLKPNEEMVSVDKGKAGKEQMLVEVATEESVKAFTLTESFAASASKPDDSPTAEKLRELSKRFFTLFNGEDSLNRNPNSVPKPTWAMWSLNYLMAFGSRSYSKMRETEETKTEEFKKAMESYDLLNSIVNKIDFLAERLRNAHNAYIPSRKGSSIMFGNIIQAQFEPKHAIALLHQAHQAFEQSFTNIENHVPTFG